MAISFMSSSFDSRPAILFQLCILLVAFQCIFVGPVRAKADLPISDSIVPCSHSDTGDTSCRIEALTSHRSAWNTSSTSSFPYGLTTGMAGTGVGLPPISSSTSIPSGYKIYMASSLSSVVKDMSKAVTHTPSRSHCVAAASSDFDQWSSTSFFANVTTTMTVPSLVTTGATTTTVNQTSVGSGNAIWSFSRPAGCGCEKCVEVGTVNLYLWPKTPSPQVTPAVTAFVSEGMTFVSPSAYMGVTSVGYTDDCGWRLYPNSTAYAIPIETDGIRETLIRCGATAPGQPYLTTAKPDFEPVTYDCPSGSFKPSRLTVGNYTWCRDCRPTLGVVTELLEQHSIIKDCSSGILFDPPVYLTSQAGLIPLTSSKPTPQSDPSLAIATAADSSNPPARTTSNLPKSTSAPISSTDRTSAPSQSVTTRKSTQVTQKIDASTSSTPPSSSSLDIAQPLVSDDPATSSTIQGPTLSKGQASTRMSPGGLSKSEDSAPEGVAGSDTPLRPATDDVSTSSVARAQDDPATDTNPSKADPTPALVEVDGTSQQIGVIPSTITISPIPLRSGITIDKTMIAASSIITQNNGAIISNDGNTALIIKPTPTSTSNLLNSLDTPQNVPSSIGKPLPITINGAVYDPNASSPSVSNGASFPSEALTSTTALKVNEEVIKVGEPAITADGIRFSLAADGIVIGTQTESWRTASKSADMGDLVWSAIAGQAKETTLAGVHSNGADSGKYRSPNATGSALSPSEGGGVQGGQGSQTSPIATGSAIRLSLGSRSGFFVGIFWGAWTVGVAILA